MLEEELRKVEQQIYALEGEYLQVCVSARGIFSCNNRTQRTDTHRLCTHLLQETVKDGNILRGWDSYHGKQASSGAIRRINRFREADRMFSASSVTSGQASTFNAASSAAPKVTTSTTACALFFPTRTAVAHALSWVCSQGGGGTVAAAGQTGAKMKKRSRPS